MGSSPIARSIFIVLISLLFPSTLLAQVEADPSRSFENGQVIDLPGTSAYLGDIPHEIEIISENLPFHTITGLLATQVGWNSSGSLTLVGTRLLSPGVLFEGIPYPFPSSSFLNWMPVGSAVEVFDFPTAAWWGPETSSGAIFFQAPTLNENSSEQLNLWVGERNLWGANNRYRNNSFALEGDYQHEVPAGTNGTDVFNISAKERWVKSDSFSVESGLLAAQWITNDNWYSAFTSILLFSPNFQSLELKPYFQTAQMNGQTVQETGGYLNYHFNAAGLAESHLGFGFNHMDFNPSFSRVNKGFVQTTNFADVLGDITVDFAFRFDFSSVENDTFSDLIGLQNNQGPFTFLADYGKGVLTSISQDIQQADLGIRFHPSDEWSTTLKYIHKQTGGHPLDGGKFQFQFYNGRTFLIVFKKVKLTIEAQTLQDENGAVFFDTGERVEFSLFPQNHFWVNGRVLSHQPFFCEVGGDYLLGKSIRVYVSVANLDNLPFSWPDPFLSVGRVFWAGIGGQF